MGTPAVFLDKDGTLVNDVPYNVEPAAIALAPGSAEGARLLHEAGYPLIVVSNQSGVARGFFAETALRRVEQRLRELLDEAGASLAGFYYCPHYPDAPESAYAVRCGCRKPEPGLMLRAAEDRDLDLARSWAIGDILNDVEAGHRAGARTILIDNGNETEWLLTPNRTPDYRVLNMAQAARIIVAADRDGR